MNGLQCIKGNSDNTYDLLIDNGSVKIGEITCQNQAFLLIAHKGEYKEFPVLGVGITDILNDYDFDAWKRNIQEQFEYDGQRVDKLKIDAAGLTIDAQYRR